MEGHHYGKSVFTSLQIADALLSRIHTVGRRLNGILGLSLNDGTIKFPVILLEKTISVR